MSFPYFNHGLGTISESLSLYVYFERTPARTAATKLLNWPDGLSPVSGSDWCGQHVHVYESYGKHDGFGGHVLRSSAYTRSSAPKGWQHLGAWAELDRSTRQLVGFEAALDDHLDRIHQRYPIAFALRVRDRMQRTSRHEESIGEIDAALERVVGQLDVSTKGVGMLATTTSLYLTLLTLRCGKHGGATMPKAKRVEHLASVLGKLDPKEPWDALRVAFKLKAEKPDEVVSQLTKKARKQVWKSAWSYQGGGSGSYSAAVFKLPKAAFEALRAEFG